MTATALDRARVARAGVGESLARVALAPVSLTQLAYYCAAAGVVDPIHYDRGFARDHGFPDAVVNGSLRVAWMTQVAADLAGTRGLLIDIACSHRGLMLVGQAPVIEARLAATAPADDGSLEVAVDLVATVGEAVCDVGRARIRLPAA